MNSITVSIQTIYGVERIYPVCERAQHFAAIAGTKTLTREALQHVKTLGFSIEVQQHEVRL